MKEEFKMKEEFTTYEYFKEDTPINIKKYFIV